MAHERASGARDATRRDATREEESARTSSLLFPFGGAEGFGLPKAAGRVSDEDRGARGWNAAAMATIEARRMRILLLTASPQDLLEPDSRHVFCEKYNNRCGKTLPKGSMRRALELMRRPC